MGNNLVLKGEDHMGKTELVEVISKKADISKKAAGRLVDIMLESIEGGLKEGDSVDLKGFGKFEMKQRAARVGRNPRTGEEIEIPAATVPVFKPSKALKAAVSVEAEEII
ncbi:DNA-binding protein HU 1 [Piscirickettsia salmonis]|uniref:DNA-binding protein HU n=2 Tax=Piscirickettsia salmonis TaxID=1238 RepID=A0A9Q6LRV1_PISSA|nr:DNA-binding protein HU [Piscirickettsia salmonis]ERL62295.1 DNA-binding protein HU [Piscirickettsia salmonis LF-89 = ATCC VR-1361]ALB22050.1 DNA-binding protein HU [Piscirickettsia salmonis]QGN76748.1 DNA-binding protein HU 1 [Piscirickettsia salmonis]QGN80338.1 DNA-binding protein HU 1 [Piscirickettsia salmonis]